MHILLIQTGGTIDKDYPRSTKGWAFEISEPASREILERINPSFTYEVESLFRKDSQEITSKDRKALQERIRETPTNHIVVTHGTDTLIQTAQYIDPSPSQVIVFTGAFKPEKFKNSDADFNLGLAIGAIHCLSPGVYVAMNGIICSSDQVKRDPQSGKFITA